MGLWHTGHRHGCGYSEQKPDRAPPGLVQVSLLCAPFPIAFRQIWWTEVGFGQCPSDGRWWVFAAPTPGREVLELVLAGAVLSVHPSPLLQQLLVRPHLSYTPMDKAGMAWEGKAG